MLYQAKARPCSFRIRQQAGAPVSVGHQLEAILCEGKQEGLVEQPATDGRLRKVFDVGAD